MKAILGKYSYKVITIQKNVDLLKQVNQQQPALIIVNENFNDNYYFGVRRYPTTTDQMKNPLTLNDMDPGESDFDNDPSIPISPLGWSNHYSVHSYGEIWSAMVWGSYERMYGRYGIDVAKDKMLTLIVESMKISPNNPTFLDARDSLILADEILNGGANRVLIWKGFAERGAGWRASVPLNGNHFPIIEDFREPDWGDYNQDGFKDTVDWLMFLEDFTNLYIRADLDADHDVDQEDFNIFNEFFSQ